MTDTTTLDAMYRAQLEAEEAQDLIAWRGPPGGLRGGRSGSPAAAGHADLDEEPRRGPSRRRPSQVDLGVGVVLSDTDGVQPDLLFISRARAAVEEHGPRAARRMHLNRINNAYVWDTTVW